MSIKKDVSEVEVFCQKKVSPISLNKVFPSYLHPHQFTTGNVKEREKERTNVKMNEGDMVGREVKVQGSNTSLSIPKSSRVSLCTDK